MQEQCHDCAAPTMRAFSEIKNAPLIQHYLQTMYSVAVHCMQHYKLKRLRKCCRKGFQKSTFSLKTPDCVCPLSGVQSCMLMWATWDKDSLETEPHINLKEPRFNNLSLRRLPECFIPSVPRQQAGPPPPPTPQHTRAPC
jgi:hypothetical protein